MIPSRKLCDCRTGDLQRVEREPWMRLVYPSRRLYRCATCDRLMLVFRSDVIEAREQRRHEQPTVISSYA